MSPLLQENEFQRQYSERTAEAIDEEVRSLVADAYERTRTLLNVRSSELTDLAELLLHKETINQVRRAAAGDGEGKRGSLVCL